MSARILIFSLAYYPNHVSGAEIALKEITDRIEPSDISFSMITHRFDLATKEEEQVGNVKVYRVGFGSGYFSKMLFVPLAAWKAASLHRATPFTSCWVMMTYMLLPLVGARLFGLRVPYLLTLQDGDSYEKVFERWRILPATPLLNWGFRHATVIQAISQSLAEWPARRGSNRPVLVIPNGASTESAQVYAPQELETLTRALNKKDGEVLLLSIGRLAHQKGIDTVIRALPLLPENVRLVVVGTGSDRTDLEQLAETLHVEKRVHFVGQVNRHETAKYRRISDIFIFPSRSEGQGISLVSSMLAGIPVVATQVGGIADFIFDAKRNPDKEPTGWAVDPDSPEQIAEAVKEILAHPDATKRVVANAERLVREQYDWNTLVPALREQAFGPILQNK